MQKSIFFLFTIVGILTTQTLSGQIEASELAKLAAQEPSKNCMPSYCYKDFHFYTPLDKKFKELVKPYYHTALVDINEQGKIVKAKVFCKNKNCSFHNEVEKHLLEQVDPSNPGILNKKFVAVTNITINLVDTNWVDEKEQQEILPPFEFRNIEKPKEPEVYLITEISPEYPGGLKFLQSKLQEKAILPKGCAPDAANKGKVFLKFIVNPSGETSDYVVLKGYNTCKEADQLAIKLISEDRVLWKPGMVDGKAVKTYVNLPIYFKSE